MSEAAVASALAASTLFQICVTIKLGRLDKFAPIAFLVGGMLAFVMALAIGAGFQLWRRRGATKPSGGSFNSMPTRRSE